MCQHTIKANKRCTHKISHTLDLSTRKACRGSFMLWPSSPCAIIKKELPCCTMLLCSWMCLFQYSFFYYHTPDDINNMNCWLSQCIAQIIPWSRSHNENHPPSACKETLTLFMEPKRSWTWKQQVFVLLGYCNLLLGVCCLSQENYVVFKCLTNTLWQSTKCQMNKDLNCTAAKA